jgi:CHAD domain-containing protein
VAFEIRKGEFLRRALKRVARAELRRARRMARDGDRPLSDRAHGLRAAVKRARALIRLTRSAGGKRARAAERQLRDSARKLAALRDAHVVVRTFDQLTAELPHPVGPGVAAVRARLVTSLRDRQDAFEVAGRFQAVAERLRSHQDRIDSWLPGRDEDEWTVLGPGIEAGYRRARDAMRRAYARPNGATFHAWRRAVKAHRFQARFVRPVSRKDLAARGKRLVALGQLLGVEHDLTVLRERLLGAAGQAGSSSLLRLLERRQRELRAQARPLGEALFAERPRDVRRRFRDDLRRFYEG